MSSSASANLNYYGSVVPRLLAVNSRETFRARRMKIMELVEEDSLILSDPTHIYYMTGLQAALESSERVLIRSGPIFLGLSRNGSMFLFAGRSSLVNPFWGDELIFDSRTLFEGNLYTYEDYEISQRVVAPLDFVAEELGEVMEEMRSRRGFELKRLGIEEWHLQQGIADRLKTEFPTITLSGISSALRKMRLTKDQLEIERISEGIGRLRTVLESAISLASVGETEVGLLERLTSSFRERYGVEAPLLGGILSGRRTLEVVGKATTKKLERREPVILDLQTRVDGYWARASATIRVEGKAGDGEDKLEALLNRLLDAGGVALVQGQTAAGVFRVVSDEMMGAGMVRGLIHEAGHGIGLSLREAPYLFPASAQKIEPGMVCVLTVGGYENPSTRLPSSARYLVGKDKSASLK